MDPRITVVSVLLVVMLIANGVSGGPCEVKMQECANVLSSAATSMNILMTAQPPNATAIVTRCQAVKQSLDTCAADLRAVCPAGLSLNTSLTSLATSYTTMCGQETLCQFRAMECSLGSSDMNQLSSLLMESSPNTELIKEKCRVLNITRAPCVERLKAECGSLSNMTATIQGVEQTFNSICGKEILCQIHIRRCSFLMGSGNGSQMCSSKQAITDCLGQTDPVCHTIPELHSIMAGINTALSMCAGQCPQIFQCVGQQQGQMNADQCSLTGNMATCIGGLKGTCPVKEDHISFSKVATLAQQMCQELVKTVNEDSFTCPGMDECLLESDLAKLTMGNSANPQIQISVLLDSQIICRYLEDTAGCYIKLNSGGNSCQPNSDLLAFMSRQRSYLKTACYSASHGVPAVLGSMAWIGLVAVLTTWAHSFL